MSSQSTGWMARVYSSARSCLILRSSTQHSVTIRLPSRRRPESGPSGPSTRSAPSAQPAGGAPGAAYVTDASLRDVQGVPGVMPEHVVEAGLGTQCLLEVG